ncbi:MAG: tRNA (adenosine(37)-N6)-threonylcarbamoyltransferase complex ATPase subunit type 1 TsaE [Bifidobacteriaceae bacterium]|jgi:tRNA threonylcarbamoyladenosine biosynthesis protein TsaE|nr:tRNA (adenosine(37)-N6)-threonylcarbamoyltransferase complex ATPase subunit type 1 TsaE [Bifidobacteriaceae bacterium]
MSQVGDFVLPTALPTAQATRQWGERLAKQLRAGDLIVLTGQLGAGKTTLVQGIGQGLAVRGAITSPTFIVARAHRSTIGGPDLIHVDAYRIGSLDEIDALDLDSSLEQAVTVVEWGEGLVEQLSMERLEIAIERARGTATGPAGEQRTVRLRCFGERWQGLTYPI